MKPLGTGGRSPLPLALIHRSAWRNCLEIRNESRSGDCRAARRGPRVVYLPLLAPTTHPPEAFQLFSKQFRKVNSPKFQTKSALFRKRGPDAKHVCVLSYRG